MELSLDGVTFPIGDFHSDAPSSFIRREWYCSDCDVSRGPCPESGTQRLLCEVCGSLCLVRAMIASSNAVATHAARWSAVIELLGEEVRDMVSAADSLQAPQRAVNESFLKSLSRCQIDSNFSILWDATLRLGPLRVMLVPAAFCKPVAGAMRGLALVKGSPECGERPLANAEFVRGRVLLLQRGRSTFAQKQRLACSLGAAALVVANTLDVFPFVMTDAAGELDTAGAGAGETELRVDIPCYMISKADARLLETLYTHAPLRGGEDDDACPNTLLISTREPERECSICQEEMRVGETVFKLHCRHVYHDFCVAAWLRTKNTCPLCRDELPAGRTTSRIPAGAGAGSGGGAQPYYV